VAWLDLRDIAPATLVEFVLEKTGLNPNVQDQPKKDAAGGDD
jgi:hypothetical protein